VENLFKKNTPITKSQIFIIIKRLARISMLRGLAT